MSVFELDFQCVLQATIEISKKIVELLIKLFT